MSAPQDSTAAAGKVDEKPTETPKDIQKPTAALEEDDEFEDFPVEGESGSAAVVWLVVCYLRTNETLRCLDWPQEDAEVPGGNTHLWEESWDDDDTSEDFSKQLKEELEKVKAGK
ncbi:hypothetical protein MMC11_003371 [Xylographa trunciseda]|nr:hypothetical protein [Xylographa trunciseda]